MVVHFWHPRHIPNEIIYGFILPLVFAEHLHRVLVLRSPQPGWHPFYTLPLVSKQFNHICESLMGNIFGLRKSESPEVIGGIFDYVRDFWVNAHLDPVEVKRLSRYGFGDGPSLSQLEEDKSLIRIYLCTAIATAFFKTDIMKPIVLEQRYLDNQRVSTEDWDVPYRMMNGRRTRAFRMKDHRMHTCFRPILAAMRLCDRVRGPTALFNYIGEYLVEISAEYVSTAFLLKASQDLEMDMVDKYAELDDRREWANIGLNVPDTVESVIRDMLGSSHFVRSLHPYFPYVRIPGHVLETTNIIEVLNQVALTDWGDDYATANLRERAENATEALDGMVAI